MADIVQQLSYFVTNEVRMPAGMICTVIEEIELLATQVKQLTEDRDGWQATAAGLSQDISNAKDEIERLSESLSNALRLLNSPRGSHHD